MQVVARSAGRACSPSAPRGNMATVARVFCAKLTQHAPLSPPCHAARSESTALPALRAHIRATVATLPHGARHCSHGALSPWVKLLWNFSAKRIHSKNISLATATESRGYKIRAPVAPLPHGALGEPALPSCAPLSPPCHAARSEAEGPLPARPTRASRHNQHPTSANSQSNRRLQAMRDKKQALLSAHARRAAEYNFNFLLSQLQKH